MDLIINDKTLTDIIWEDNDGNILSIPEGIETVDIECDVPWNVDAIILPKSIKKIAVNFWADTDCVSIGKIDLYYNGILKEWCEIDKDYSGIELIGLYGYDLYVRDDKGDFRAVVNLTIEEKKINPMCFFGCASIRSVTIYSSIISEDAFQNCKNLKKVFIYGASTQLIENCNDFACTYPFDEREDLEIEFSVDAMDSIFEDRDCSLLGYANPLKVIETGDDIREIIETVDNMDSEFYEKTGLNEDSPLSKIYYTYIKYKAQNEIYEEYDYLNEDESVEETEDRTELSDTESVISYDSYVDLYELYKYICLTEKRFLSYKTELEKALSALDKLAPGFEHNFDEERQLEKTLVLINVNILAFQGHKGKSMAIRHSIESVIDDIFDARDRISEDAAFTINEIDCDEKLLNPLSGIVCDIERTEEFIEYICEELTRTKNIIEEELRTGETNVWRKLNEQKEDLEELNGEISKALDAISDAFQEAEENLCVGP